MRAYTLLRMLLVSMFGLVVILLMFEPPTGAAPRATVRIAQASPDVTPTGAYIAQSPSPVITPTGGSASVTLSAAPPNGDMLIIFVASTTPIPVPTNFSTPAPYFVPAASPGPLQIFYGVVGKNGLTSATTYSLGSGTLIAQLFDVAGENQLLAPSFSVDAGSPTATPTGQVSRNETVLTPQGLTLAAFAGNASTHLNWLPTPSGAIFTASPPGGVTASPISTPEMGNNGGSSPFGVALAVSAITSEAFIATPNPFTFVGTFLQKPGFLGSAGYNGVVVTILPAPSPTPTPILATPPAGEFYISARYNELGGNNGTYDQPSVVTFETNIGHRLAVNSHFHAWTDVFPFANSTSNPAADSTGLPSPLPTTSPYNTPYDLANTDEEDDAVNGRYVLTTWNCGDTDWNVAHGVDDNQIIATAYRMKAFGQPIFVRYFHEMNLNSTSDGHTACLDGLASPNPVPAGYNGSSANLSGDITPNPLAMPTTLGYFNPGEWKAAFIHVHDLVRSIAPNVNFVFVPSGGGMGDPLSFQPHMYYPGDRFVEWIGFDDYERRSYGTFNGFNLITNSPLPCATGGPTPGPTYYCPDTVYTEVTGSAAFTQVPWQSPTPKPLFVTETAAQPTDQPTWLGLSGGRSIIAQTLASNYAQIAALSYFDSQASTNDWVLTGRPPSPSPTPPNGYSLFGILAGDTNSAPGPSPSPSPSPTTAAFTVKYGSVATSTSTSIPVVLPTPPADGDTLIVALVTANPISLHLMLPASWTALTAATNASLETAYCTVNTILGHCSTKNYSFGTTTGGGMAQIYDIHGGSTAAPIAAPDIYGTAPVGLNVINEQVSNLLIPSTGGFTLTLWSGEAAAAVLNYPGTATPNPNGLYQSFPASGTQLSAVTNQAISGSAYASLVTYMINRETSSLLPFAASARYFNNIPSPGPTGVVRTDGTIIWLHGP